jgi:hypothetical protein
MTDNVDWDEFTLEIDGIPAIAPCFQLELYTWFHDGVGDFYERSRAALSDLISHYQTDSMKRTRKLDVRAETIVPTWVTRLRAGKTYWAYFTGCETERGISPASLELFFFETPPNARSPQAAEQVRAVYREMLKESGSVITPFAMMMRVTFPVDHELARPARALPWILDLKAVNSYPFLSGHAGYGLNVDRILVQTSAATRRKLGSLLQCYPGLDWDNAEGRSDRVLRFDAERAEFFPVVKRAAWINLVADSTLERLGGRAKLRRDLGEDLPITMHELAHGVVTQAGEAPQLGDVARRDFLPAHRRVAKVLRPLRIESISGVGRDFTDEDARAWLNAFDKEYD